MCSSPATPAVSDTVQACERGRNVTKRQKLTMGGLLARPLLIHRAVSKPVYISALTRSQHTLHPGLAINSKHEMNEGLPAILAYA